MADSWEEALAKARDSGREQVYHDFDTGTFGCCGPQDRPGHFEGGRFVEHACICMPATLTAGELREKEERFLEENPDWPEG